MKALVIGGCGYIGSHVVDELIEKGLEAYVVDREKSEQLNPKAGFLKGDVLDKDFLNKIIKGMDYVFHFAGIADIKEALEKPEDTIKVNVLGLTHILNACVNHKVKRFIYASSAYVYSRHGGFYKTSKQCAEILIESFYDNRQLPYTILRYGSLYGPRANHFNFIHNAIKEALDTGKITRKGNGEELREYIHVRDAAAATVKEIDNEKKQEYLLLTGHQPKRVKEVLSHIKEILNDEPEIIYTNETMEGHYELSPYSFRPKVAKKVVLDSYHDLGQGLLECIHEIYDNQKTS